MLFFFLCVALLVLGYFIYGKIVEKVFTINVNRTTPAYELEDDIDYIPMPTWKVFMVQLLDIAGAGPIFGPILGALYGPQALIWIVIGCIFGGGVHDFFSGMLSVRSSGKSIPEVVGDALGMPARHVMRLFSIVLLVLVGVVFVLAPAKLLNQLTGYNVTIYVVLIFVYYFIATILPIDKIIGRFYPIFGALLLFMTFAVGFAMIFGGVEMLPNLDFWTNTNPNVNYDGSQLPAWPLLFVTISCSALSGFHSTQSPLMARCLKSEKKGRFVFYGAMIAEGIIGLIWCTAGLSYYNGPEALADMLKGTPSAVVNDVSFGLLGPIGGFLAILGVIILPITSGDTAFRSTRLILSEIFKISQKPVMKRLILAVPLFIVAYIITKLPFGMIWKYFGWSNQTLACLVLWSAAIWLAHKGKCHWIATLPAVFMTAVVVTFICYMKIGFQMPYGTSVAIGIAAALVSFFVFMIKAKPQKDSADE